MLQGRSRRELHSSAIRHNAHPTCTAIAGQFLRRLKQKLPACTGPQTAKQRLVLGYRALGIHHFSGADASNDYAENDANNAKFLAQKEPANHP